MMWSLGGPTPSATLRANYRTLPFPLPAVEADDDNFARLGADNLPGPPVAEPFAEDYRPIVRIAQPIDLLPPTDILGLTRRPCI